MFNWLLTFDIAFKKKKIYLNSHYLQKLQLGDLSRCALSCQDKQQLWLFNTLLYSLDYATVRSIILASLLSFIKSKEECVY